MISFHSRAVARLDEIRKSAGCFVVVTHSMAEVERMCDRVLWMDHGELIADGTPDEIIAAYLESSASLSNKRP